MNSTIKKNLILLILVLIMILMFSVDVFADFGEGLGKPPADFNNGVWFTAEGKGSAWQEFYNAQRPNKYSNDTSFFNAINSSGKGAKKADGSFEPMVDTCKASDFIYWYGSNNDWVLTGPAPAYKKTYYQRKEWFTAGNNTNASNKYWIEPISAEARDDLRKYESWSSNWTGGKVVLICSNSYNLSKKPALFFKANSATHIYDGTNKTVSGLHPDSKYSVLKPGHKHNAVATRTEKQAGKYDVVFNTIIITDSAGKVVTTEYDIKTENGRLIISSVPPPKDDPPIGTDPEKEWRCVNHITESAKANTKNRTVGYHAFTPSGAPHLQGLERSRYTDAGLFLLTGYKPRQYDPVGDWYSWKSEYEAGTDEETLEINLDDVNVSDVLSKWGGVYNVYRSFKEDTYTASHCQPQDRFWIPDADWTDGQSYRPEREYEPAVYDKDGKKIRNEVSYRPERPYIPPHYQTPAHWSPWKDLGGRIVWSFSGPSTRVIENNYQILSVNCNKSEFNNYVGLAAQIHSLSNGDGGASMSTRESSGSNPGVLGRGSHRTAQDSFYLDGTSCKNVFKCTPDVLHWSDSDIENNNTDPELFNEIKPTGTGEDYIKVTYPSKYLTFFRDNVDNEIRANIWHPRATGVSDLDSFEGNEALNTYGMIYEGTPEIALTTIAPIGGGYWGGDYGKITATKTEKTWDYMLNRFVMKSQWTSYDGKPYKVGLNWKYEGYGENQVPSKANGYKVLSEKGYYGKYYWDVYCDFENARTIQEANIPRSPFVDGHSNTRQWAPNAGVWDNKSIKVFFTRSVSDS